MNRSIRQYLILTAIFFLSSSICSARTIYVTPTGADANNGLSWTAAKQHVQAGIKTAGKNNEVWIAAGTYYERIVLSPGVSVYGGFAGTEATRDQRNPHANVTTLDGQKKNTVVKMPSASTGSKIDGFVITNGKGSAGGGIYCGNKSSLVIANNLITGNASTFGGGIYCDSRSSVEILNNRIVGNTSACTGGIMCASLSTSTITNNTIVNNGTTGRRQVGAGMYFANSRATVVNNIIAFNTSGIDILGPNKPVIKNNNIYGNTAFNGQGISNPVGKNGNISADPLFENRAGGDYHIQSGSPCIDVGNDTAVGAGWRDMDWESRQTEFSNAGKALVDIGADEKLTGDGITIITFDDASGASGEGVRLRATIRNSSGEPLDCKQIHFRVLDYQGYGHMQGCTMADGVATVSFTIPADWAEDSTHQMRAYFEGDEEEPYEYPYESSDDAILMVIHKDTPTFTVDDVTGDLGETVNLKATLKCGTTPIEGEYISWYVNGRKLPDVPPMIGSVTDENGVVTYSHKLSGYQEGLSYTINACFNGNDDYYGCTGKGLLEITGKITTSLSVTSPQGRPDTEVIISARIRGSDWSAPVGRTINLKIDTDPNDYTAVTQNIDEGYADLIYHIPSGMAYGNHTITATFEGDSDYKESSTTGGLTVTWWPTYTDNTVTDFFDNSWVVPGNTCPLDYLGASLKDINGNAVRNAVLTFELKKISDPDTAYILLGTSLPVNNRGNTVLPYPIPSETPYGYYNVRVKFAGDFNHNLSSHVGNITVSPNPKGIPNIIIQDFQGAPSEEIILSATMQNAGGQGIGNKTLNFFVGTDSLGSATTNASGYAEVSYTVPPEWLVGYSTYIAVKFDGDYEYTPANGGSTLYIVDTGTVATPAIVLPSGTYTLPQRAVVTCSTLNAIIHYTTDGFDPTESSPTVMSGDTVTLPLSPTFVPLDLTLKAKAFIADWTPSGVRSVAYTLAPSKIIYVKQGGTGNGLSWSSPFGTIQDGINEANYAADGGVVLVAGGNYYEALTLKSNAAVYGGYRGTSGTDLTRDTSAYVSTIDGTGTNSPGVLVEWDAAHTLLDGFTITNCADCYYGGYAICCMEGSSPIISHNRIKQNTGGGIGIYNSTARISNNWIAGNTSYGVCGVYIGNDTWSSSTITDVINNTIVDYTGVNSVGIYCAGAQNAQIISNIVTGNTYGLNYIGANPPIHHHNCIFENTSGDYCGGLASGSTDKQAPPNLAFDRMHIQPNSPCIDVGDDFAVQASVLAPLPLQPGDLDIDYENRQIDLSGIGISGVKVDMGADESTGESCYYPVFTLTADLYIQEKNLHSVCTAHVHNPVTNLPVSGYMVYIDSMDVATDWDWESGSTGTKNGFSGYGNTNASGDLQFWVTSSTQGTVKVKCHIVVPPVGTHQVSVPQEVDIWFYDSGIPGVDWPMFHFDKTLSGATSEGLSASLTRAWGGPRELVSTSGQSGASSTSSPAVVGGLIYVGTHAGYLYKIDSNTGTVIGSTILPSSGAPQPIVGTPCVYDNGSGNVVYVTTQSGPSNKAMLFALNPGSLAVQWSYTCLESWEYINGSPIAHDGVVYFGTHAPYGGSGASSPREGRLHAISIATHKDLTDTGPIGDPSKVAATKYAVGYASPSVDVAKGGVYIGDVSCYVTAINWKTGAWKYEWGPNITESFNASIPILDGYLFQGSNSSKVWRVWDSGSSLSSDSSFPTNGIVNSTPAAYNHRLYVCTGSGKVYCAQTDGATFDWGSNPTIKQWETPVLDSSGIIASPALSIPTNTLFVATYDAKIYALNAGTGAYVLLYDIRTQDGRPSATITSSPAISRGGLYITVDDGIKRYLYCFTQ